MLDQPPPKANPPPPHPEIVRYLPLEQPSHPRSPRQRTYISPEIYPRLPLGRYSHYSRNLRGRTKWLNVFVSCPRSCEFEVCSRLLLQFCLRDDSICLHGYSVGQI